MQVVPSDIIYSRLNLYLVRANAIDVFHFNFIVSIVLNVHQQKTFLPFGHGRNLAAFKGTGLQNKSFQDRAEISKA